MSARALLALALLACLAACGGGGGDDDDGQQPTPGVNCTARPELCK